MDTATVMMPLNDPSGFGEADGTVHDAKGPDARIRTSQFPVNPEIQEIMKRYLSRCRKLVTFQKK